MTKSMVAVCAALPLLAVTWVRLDGVVVATSYREPKLAVALVAAATMVAVFLLRGAAVVGRQGLLAELKRPAAAALVGLTMWVLLGAVWAEVPAHVAYEALQWSILAILFVILRAWNRTDPDVGRGLRLGLTGAGAAVTAVALVQLVTPIPGLLPVRPEAGVDHASLFGFKNPTAHVLVGVAGLTALTALRSRPWPRRLLLFLMVVELAVVGSLGSRTAWLAVGCAAAVAVVLAPGRRPRVLVGAALTATVITMLLTPWGRQRAQSLGDLVDDPSVLSESPRGVYWRNTIHMAALHPTGVGAGNWLVQYPVHRRWDRDVGFDARVQVLRAHNDHLQLLAELGWPGAVAWSLFLAGSLLALLRRPRGDPFQWLGCAQLVAWIVAMSGDYVVEIPGLRWTFILVVVSLTTPSGKASHDAVEHPTPSPSTRILAGMLVLASLPLAGLHLARDRSHLLERHLFGELQRRFQSDWTVPARRRAFAELEPQLREAGRRVDALPGLPRATLDHAAIQLDVETLAGRPRQAVERGLEALRIRPFAPNVVATLAEVYRPLSPATADRLTVIHRSILSEASSGYEAPRRPAEVAAWPFTDSER